MHVSNEDVKKFWEENPLCISMIPHEPGSADYFQYYDHLREEIESVEYSHELHEYSSFSGKNVLDVGCGNGYILSKYATNGANTFGIDITEIGVELSKKRFQLESLQGDFRVADAQNLPYEDNFFDCVCSMGVLHHVPDTKKGIEEIYRVLKPGGRLIVMFYHKNSAKYQLSYRILSLFSGKSMDQLVNEFDGKGNPKGSVFTKKTLSELLHDFDNIELEVGYVSNNDIVVRGGKFLPKNMFKILEPILGWNLYAKAIKPNDK